jgi:hypothetical protein
LGATNLCLRYAPAKCGKFDVSQCFFQFCYLYLEIYTISSYHIVRTRITKVTNFLPFCTIGISMYQKRILPYFIILSTFSPHASSPFGAFQTEKFQHPFHPYFFPPLSAQGPTRRRNSTGLAELWGGWPIELVCAQNSSSTPTFFV